MTDVVPSGGELVAANFVATLQPGLGDTESCCSRIVHLDLFATALRAPPPPARLPCMVEAVDDEGRGQEAENFYQHFFFPSQNGGVLFPRYDRNSSRHLPLQQV